MKLPKPTRDDSRLRCFKCGRQTTISIRAVHQPITPPLVPMFTHEVIWCLKCITKAAEIYEDPK